jgi:flagellar biosynthesis regulator FlbT
MKMLLPVELLFFVANMMILIPLERQNPGWEFKRELQVLQLKTVP